MSLNSPLTASTGLWWRTIRSVPCLDKVWRRSSTDSRRNLARCWAVLSKPKWYEPAKWRGSKQYKGMTKSPFLSMEENDTKTHNIKQARDTVTQVTSWWTRWYVQTYTPINHDKAMGVRVVPNWVKFHILIYLSPFHKYPIKEGFLRSLGVKSNKKPCRQNHRLAMGTFLLPLKAYSFAAMV